MNTKTKNGISQHQVNVFEYESGMGSRLDEVRYFATEQEALKCVEDFNSLNIDDTVPDWYMIAEYVKLVPKKEK